MSEDAFNKLSPAEVERLALLSEELGEAQQIIGKILRHGYDSYHPRKSSMGSNTVQLEKELGDIEAAIQLMYENQDISIPRIEKHIKTKLDKVWKYLHHNSRRTK